MGRAGFVFSRPVLVIAIFVCLLALINGWKVSRAGGEIDFVEVTAGATGLGNCNFLMLVVFGVAISGRYLLPTFVCGFVIVLRRLVGGVRPIQLTKTSAVSHQPTCVKLLSPKDAIDELA
jgi:hypothetical protein